MIAKASDLTQGDEFWTDGQLYRVSVNVKQNDDERKVYAYRAEGLPGLVVIWLPSSKMVPIKEKDAPPE